MTDVQLTPPLPTRPVAPSSLPACQALFAVSTVTLAVTGVALFAILGLGVFFLAFHNRNEGDKGHDEGKRASSRNASSSSPRGGNEAQKNCRVIADNLAKYAKHVPADLVEAFCKYNAQVTPENIMEAAQLLCTLKERVLCVSLTEEAKRILQVYEFKASQSSPPRSLGPDYSMNPGGISNGQLMSEQNREYDIALALDRSNKVQEEIRESERKELEAIKESERLAEEAKEEEERQRLEVEKQRRIEKYRLNILGVCAGLSTEIGQSVEALRLAQKQLTIIGSMVRIYDQNRVRQTPMSSEEITKMEERKKLDLQFLNAPLPKFENEFKQRYTEFREALRGINEYSKEGEQKVKELDRKYEEYTGLIGALIKDNVAKDFEKWKKMPLRATSSVGRG